LINKKIPPKIYVGLRRLLIGKFIGNNQLKTCRNGIGGNGKEV